MANDVDLRELAIDRGSESTQLKRKRSLISRYVLPALLLLGFIALTGWAARDYVFPPRSVTVVPVFSTTSEVRQEGAALFQAAGWIEPRPTPIRVAALAPGVVEELLLSFRGRYTVIVVTHNLQQARRIADYAAFFWATDGTGTLIEHGTGARIFDQPQQPLTVAYVNGKTG